MARERAETRDQSQVDIDDDPTHSVPTGEEAWGQLRVETSEDYDYEETREEPRHSGSQARSSAPSGELDRVGGETAAWRRSETKERLGRARNPPAHLCDNSGSRIGLNPCKTDAGAGTAWRPQKGRESVTMLEDVGRVEDGRPAKGRRAGRGREGTGERTMEKCGDLRGGRTTPPTELRRIT